MRFYWPNAICNCNGKSCHLSTSEACTSKEGAYSAIDCWKEQFDLACSWIEDRGEHNESIESIVDMHVYVNAFGDKIYPTLRK